MEYHILTINSELCQLYKNKAMSFSGVVTVKLGKNDLNQDNLVYFVNKSCKSQ